MSENALLELADRCEHATADDGVGSFIITAFMVMHPEPPSGYQPRGYPAFSPEWNAWCKVNCAIRNHVQHGAYLDAAMLLIPEDMRDEIEITTLYQIARVGINLNHGPDGGPFYGENRCNSIPLAICATALRALAIAPIEARSGETEGLDAEGTKAGSAPETQDILPTHTKDTPDA